MKSMKKRLFWRKAILVAEVLFLVGYVASQNSWSASTLTSSESWLIREIEEDSSDTDLILSVGRVVGVTQTEVKVENDLDDGVDSYPRLATVGVILTPPVDPKAANQLCDAIRSNKGAKDYLWFHNGDETSCEILELNRRFLIFRAFGAVIKTPRYRIMALRFGR